MTGSVMGKRRVLVALFVSALFTALALVGNTHKARSQYAELQRLELRRWSLQEDYSRLLLEYSTHAAPHRVHRTARVALAMRKPDLQRYRVVAP